MLSRGRARHRPGGALGDLTAIRPCSPPPPCNLRCARVGALCQEPPPRSRVCHACPASRPVLCERCSTHADCALNAPPPPPSLPGRVHWVVYPAAPQAREMSCDRPARRCITSVDDRRCERGHPHTALGLGLRAATRVASLPTWVVTGGLPPLRARPRRLERSRFASRRSAHGSRPCLGGPIQPPTACYRHSQPQRGPNAARNVALYAGALWRLRCSPPFTQAAGFVRGEVHVCRNQRVVRAELIARRHRGLGARERPGRPFYLHLTSRISLRRHSVKACRYPPVSPRRYGNLACAIMAFKTRPSVYRIDIAPTSRARCRGPCKQPICKGDLRIAITAFVRPNRSTLLARCCHCIDARFASAVLAVYGTADRVPAAQGVSEEGAAQVRVTLKNSAI